MKKIKIFISSPSDVEQERSISMTVLNRLNRRYKEHLNIEGVFWKEKPLSAGGHFQDEIENPSSADIVVVILWSRLGTNLSLKYKGKITGKQPVTGTEWEFEDAMNQYKTCGKPHVIVYKKNIDIFGAVGNKEEYERKTNDKSRLDDFMRHWFVNEDGTFKAAFHLFEHLKEFENRLETHLEELIKNYLKDIIGSNTRWFKGSPFRGLNSFELEHEDIFFGRREQIYQIRTTFLNLVKKEHPFLLIIGASGCGKSSLLKAGVLPYLIQSDVVKDVAIIKYSIFKPNDNQSDLLHSLTNAIFKTLEKELTHLSYTPQILKELFMQNEDCMKPIEHAINKIKDEKQLIEEAKVKIIIIIDQFEEIFTNKAFSQEQKEQFIRFINILVKSNFVWVLASMRSDFIKHTDNLPELKELLSQEESKYLLSFPSTSQTRELIIKPAYEAGVRYERKDGKYLDEVLLETATKNGTSLPLLEYVLEELYLARDKENILTFESYEKMGKIEGAIGQKAEAVYNSLTSSGQKAFESLMRMLVIVVSDNNGQRSAKTIAYESIKESKDKRDIVDIMSSPEIRLFVKDKDTFGNVVIRVAHEALFNSWNRAIEIIITSQQDIIIRERLEKISNDWKNADKKDEKSLLLNDGLPLNEALDLVNRRKSELNENILNFVEHSQNRIKQRRWQKRGLVAVGIIGSFAMYSLAQNAKAEEEKAQKAKVETEKLAEFMLNDLKDKLAPIGRLDILQDVQREVGKYLKLGEQNSSKHSENNLNIEKVKERLLESLQEFEGDDKSLNSFQNYEYIQSIYQKIMRKRLKEENRTEFSVLLGMQIEINKYLESIQNQNTSLKSLSLRAKSHSNQGEIYELEGKSKEALKEYLNAVKIYKELLKLDPENPEWKQKLALNYDYIGLIYDHNLSDLQVALKFFQEALKIREELIKLNPNRNRWQFDVSTSYVYIAAVYMNQGKVKEAEQLYKDSLKIRKRLVKLEPDNNDLQRALATNYRQIGYIYYTKFEFEKALQEYKKTLEIRELLIMINPNNNLWKFELSRSYTTLGLVYLKQGALLDSQTNEKKQEAQEKYNMAKKEYKKSLKIYKELVEFAPNNTDWLIDLSLNYITLSMIYQYEGNFLKAMNHSMLAQDIYNQLLAINPNNTTWKSLLALNYRNIAEIYRKDGNPNKAFIAYGDSIHVKKELVSFDPNNLSWQDQLAITYDDVGELHKKEGNSDKALKAFNASIEIREKLININPNNMEWYIHLSKTYENIGRIYLKKGELDKSLDAYHNQLKNNKILVNFEPNNIVRHKNLAITYSNIAGIYKKLKNPLDALKEYENSLEITKNLIIIAQKDDNLQDLIFKTLDNMGKIYVELGDSIGAENSLEMYNWLIELEPGSKYFQRGIALNYYYLSLIEYNLNKISTDKSRKYMKDAVSFLQKSKDDGYLHKDNYEFFKGSLL